MRCLSFAITCLLSSVALAQVDPSLFAGLSYRLVGPFRAGRTLACTGVPAQLDKYYMGAVGGGVWVTENSGRTWTPIMDGERVASIGAIAVAPSNPQVIYVGSGEADMRSDIQQGNGMYKSTDGGSTWARIGLEDSRQIGKVLVDPRDANTVYVAALGHQFGPNEQRGVFKSTDGGRTWVHALKIDDNTGAIDLAMDPADPQTIVAAMWQTRRPPWEVYPPSSGPGSGLYKTSDAGATWQKVERGLPVGFGRVGLSFAKDRLYAVVDTNGKPGGGIFVSRDKGNSWTLTTGDERLWGRGWYFGGITADPVNSETVYVMNTGMYRSTDGGKNFFPIKSAPGGDDYHTLWVNPADPKRMIAATDQGTIISVDDGKTWSSWWNQPTGQFYHVTADNRVPYWIMGSQQDSGAMAVPSRSSHDIISMRDWRPMSVGGESGTIAADRLHPGTIIDNGGSIERLQDGWHKRVDPTAGQKGPWRNTWTLPIAGSPVNPKVFYTSHQCVFRSGDSGDSWQIISPDLTRQTHTTPTNLDGPTAADIDAAPLHGVVFSLAPSPRANGRLWAGTDDGLIWLTRDDGKHWQNVTPPELTPWSTVGILDAGHFDTETAYAAIDRHRLDDNHPYIYRTHDGGKHWELIVAGLPSGEFVNVVREDPVTKGLLYAGTDWGIFVSFDDGGHWQPLQLNLPAASIRDLVIAGDDLVVATHGRAFWILDNVTPLRQATTVTGTTLLKPADAMAFIRPPGFDDGTPLPKEEPRAENPPDGALIDYVLASPATLVTLSIKDPNGKEVGRFSSADKQEPPDPTKLTITSDWVRPRPVLETGKGAHRFAWDFGDGPKPGNYVVTLAVDGKPFTQALKIVADPRRPKRT